MTAAPHEQTSRRWWFPTISVGLWLIFFLGINLSQWRSYLVSGDGDTCLHRRIGDWIIEHHDVIRADPFSFTRPGKTVVTMEWLSQLTYAVSGDFLGWGGLALVAAILIATSLWLLHRQLLAEGNELILSTVLTMIAAWACSMHWLARPHLVSFVLIIFWNWQLRQFDRGQLTTHQIFARLVPLMILWVNLHAGFLVGLTLIGIYFFGTGAGLFDRDTAHRAAVWRKMFVWAGLGIACLLASLINPNGWGLHRYVFGFLGQSHLVGLVDEFRSPNFHSEAMRGFLVFLLVLVLTMTAVRPRWKPTEILLIIWAGLSALRWARNVPIAALVITPILAEHLNEFLRTAPESPWLKWYRHLSADITGIDQRSDGRVLVWLAVPLVVFLIAKPVITTTLVPDRFPIGAVAFVRQHPEAAPGEMFNDYGWGGYLIYALPERKVFIDGRNDFYGEELLDEFATVNTPKPGWDAVLAKYRVGWTILPTGHPLNAILSLRSDWRQAYADDVCEIYSHTP